MQPKADNLPALARKLFLPALFVFAVAGRAFFWSPQPEGPELTEFSGQTMGTTFTVKVAGDLSVSQVDDITAAIARELEVVDQSMSTWKEDSELSRFNRGGLEPVVLSEPTWQVFAAAEEVHRASEGAFDVTVGPLVNLWGFGPDGREVPEPQPEQLSAAMARVGQDKLLLDPAARSAQRQHPELYVDLSAIAKGYAVDRVALALEQLGQRRYLVEVGGELRAGDDKAPDQPWRVAVEQPSAQRGAVHSGVPLKNQSMATSGDYRNFIERGGVRRSHTIDPRTGQPISHAATSVTVLHDDCLRADAWATAINVLGPQAGMALAEQQELAVMMLVREGAELRELQSIAWTESLSAPHVDD